LIGRHHSSDVRCAMQYGRVARPLQTDGRAEERPRFNRQHRSPQLHGRGPSLNPIQDYVDYDSVRHTNVDTYERVREADLKQAAIIMASYAYHAAMRSELMPRPAQRPQ
jgi:hypothetical protein